jgi:hypothetical protein
VKSPADPGCVPRISLIIPDCGDKYAYDVEEGCVTLRIKPLDIETPITGEFLVFRTDETTNFSSWSQIANLLIDDVRENDDYYTLYRDFSIAAGVKYQYGIRQIDRDGSLLTDMVKSQIVSRDFEYTYIGDKDHQLKLKFNPKISSFKNTILETKTDTIGGKYPFVFRNGRVEYKEFPISGLISLQSDPNELFLKGVQF